VAGHAADTLSDQWPAMLLTHYLTVPATSETVILSFSSKTYGIILQYITFCSINI
jgi:hypothetical protein